MGSCCSCESVSSPGVEPVGDWVRLGVAGVVAAQSMIFGLAINLSPPEGTARMVLHGALAISAVAVFLLAGGPVLERSWRALLRGRIVFDQLFLLGMLAAFAASVHCTVTGVGHVYYEIVAILLAIYTFGGLITEKRKQEALTAAASLGAEFSTCEVITSDGTIVETEVGQVRPGDTVWIRAGGPVAVDGTVVDGVSFVQEAALTGEPFPVVKRLGDQLRAGSYAIDGGLRVRADRAGGGRGLDTLLEALRDAQARPSRLQREVDRLAAWFLPIVVVMAGGTFASWTYLAGWQQGLFNALAVILVACPCAMGIATPVAIWSALSGFVRWGLHPRDGDLVEKLASVRVAVFDKTGTLGEEVMEVVDFVAAEGVDRLWLRRAASALEEASEHPIARAFRNLGERQNPASDVRILPGKGISGVVDGRELCIGNSGILAPTQEDAAASLAAHARSHDSLCRSVYITTDGVLAGVASLRETLREGAKEAISQLESLGIRCEVMTGDRPEAASALGLPNARAGLSPTDKAKLIRALEDSGQRCVFVGDGINDSAAMLEASAALAIRSGTALAREASDGTLAGANLPALPQAILRARKAVRSIRGNLLFAACYNASGVTLAALGFLHPVAAALIMLASSFTVTWRALKDADADPLHGGKPIMSRPASKAYKLTPGWAATIAAVAIFLQGLALSWLGSFPPKTAVPLVFLFGLAAVGLFLLCMLRPLGDESRSALLMFSVGGLAMLTGWWADVGFLPVVRDGVCLCNCPDSTLGLGIFLKPNWMSASMVVASLPMLFIARAKPLAPSAPRLLCWGGGLLGMLFGMQAAAWLSSFLPTTNPHLNFFAGYGAMLFGMALGMTLACSAARKVSQ